MIMVVGNHEIDVMVAAVQQTPGTTNSAYSCQNHKE